MATSALSEADAHEPGLGRVGSPLLRSGPRAVTRVIQSVQTEGPVELNDIDLLDLDRFRDQEHFAMFDVLRRESPVHWHEEPEGNGFWNVVRHADLVEVNRQPELFSSEVSGISIFDMEAPSDGSGMDTRGVMMISA